MQIKNSSNELKIHPFASLFPKMQDMEFAALLEDIKKNGLRQPVWVLDNMLLDGVHRWKSCQKLGIPCPTRKYEGKNPLSFIVSMNLHRRHLSESQRAMVASALANMRQGARTDLKLPADLPEVSQTTASRMLNVSERLLRGAKTIQKENPKLALMVSRGEKTVTQAIREIIHSKKPKVEPPQGKYKVIYADPPWHYGNSGLQQYGHASHHYPPMTISELCDLPIKALGDENSVLFLWVTSPLLQECFEVINAWGYKYKASLVWDKDAHNYGHYVSVRHEFLLICTRGSCLPETKKLFPSVLKIKRTKHSEKPNEFRKMIEAMYPTGRRIELFARAKHDGWASWGNEVI